MVCAGAGEHPSIEVLLNKDVPADGEAGRVGVMVALV